MKKKRQNKLVFDRNMRNEQLKSSGESKFYYGTRNNQIVKLDKDMKDDEIETF